MNGLGEPIRKKSNPKNWKNSKNQSEIAACEQKPLARTRIFVQTPYSHSTSKIDKKFHAAPFPISAWPKSLLQFDFKNHENEWTDLKKRTAPQYNSNSLNCKNQEKANNSPSYRWAAINKT